MSVIDKPIILTFVGNYLPGYKAGGILRTIVNTVDHLCDEFEFRIVTRDRDLGDNYPYAHICHNEWQPIGNAMVYYLRAGSSTTRQLFELVKSTPHQAIWLNSFFDPLTIKVLLSIKLCTSVNEHVIVAPRGEFAWASLKQKYPKKRIFIDVARLFRLYSDVTWHASSELEALDIGKYMNVTRDAIRVMDDFPIKAIAEESTGLEVQATSTGDCLRVIFLSRIAREKNLDYALRILQRIRARVVFDIYGPAPDTTYWNECQNQITKLPANVIANYLGSANPNQVVHIFSRYDLFLFPSGGEAYGHVIPECLTSGTPVLTSNQTAWRDLQSDGLGWDLDLAQEDSFVAVIENLALQSPHERLEKRALVKTKFMERLSKSAVFDAHRQIFNNPRHRT